MLPTIDSKDHVLTFGQYRGMKIREVMEIRPDYLIWCHNNIESFDLHYLLLEEIEDKAANWRP